MKLLFVPEAKVYHTHAATLWSYVKKKWKIGFWKIVVLKTHPGKILKDSHTPQTLKLQMLLTLSILGSILVGMFFKLFLLLGFVFLVTSISLEFPFMKRLWKTDTPLAMLTPLFVWSRSLALAVGLICGMVRFTLGTDTAKLR